MANEPNRHSLVKEVSKRSHFVLIRPVPVFFLPHPDLIFSINEVAYHIVSIY